MIRQRKIELLAPAKNLECGIAAVDHGADAIYIGAPRFGARAAAGNSLEDIAELVRYAHVYNVRIYVTVNTILKDEELKDTEKAHILNKDGVYVKVDRRGKTPLNSQKLFGEEAVNAVRSSENENSRVFVPEMKGPEE